MEHRYITDLLFARSENAIAAMAKHFGKRLYATAWNILNTHQDAEETVSDTYSPSGTPSRRSGPIPCPPLSTGWAGTWP